MAVSTPEHDPGDLITGVMLQITQHAERLALLDQREATHFRETAERLADIARTLAEVSGQVGDVHDVAARQSALLDTLDGLDKQVATLATRLTTMTGSRSDADSADEYQPVPAPRWWKLDGRDREEALARLRAWVEQIYRPGYGHLAAALGPCWDQHPLCLYGLDWLMELWSVLYLTPSATPQPSPAKPNGKPVSCPPSPNSSTSKPPAASTLRRLKTGDRPTQPTRTTVGAQLTGARALHRDHRSRRGRAGAPQLSPGRPTVTANGPSEDRLHR